jgi:DNA repair protein RecO (recombination protein O)
MASYKTRGIVLRRHNLGEADRIVTFLTSDRGKLRAVARGVRRIKSRQAGHLELFSETDLMLAEGRNLDIITSARLLIIDDRLTSDMRRLSTAYLMAEMTDALLGDAEPQADIYACLQSGLAALRAGNEPQLVELFFKLRMLADLGYEPQLAGCHTCQAADPAAHYYFDPSAMALYDGDHRPVGVPELAVPAIKLWRLVLTRNLSDVLATGATEHAVASLAIINTMYVQLFGRRFKAEALLMGT